MSRVALIVLNGVVAVTAIGGGAALVAGLEASRFPPDLLKGTPFHDYTLPGLILATVVGGTAAAATIALLFKARRGVHLAMLAGAVLSGWIIGEVAILSDPRARSWTEAVYFLIGLVVVVLAAASTPRSPHNRVEL